MNIPFFKIALPASAFAVAVAFAVAQERGKPAAVPSPAQSGPVTLISNVRIFDGRKGELSAPSHVLVRGNVVEKISTTPIATDRRVDTTLIDGSGKTLMPGLIDVHVHTMMESVSLQTGLTSEISYIALAAGKAAEAQLLRGFTTVRDVGGNCFALKRSIDEGLYAGPRIYPSGGGISKTGGHGDFRMPTDVPRDRTTPSLNRTHGHDLCRRWRG